MTDSTAVIPKPGFGLTDEIVARVAKRAGVRPARTPHFSEAARPSVHMWVKAIGSRNRLAFDETYARQSCYGTIVAPGTFLYAVDDTVHMPAEPTLASCYADVMWEFFHPLRLGTKLSAASAIDQVVVKDSALAGKAFHQTSTTEYTDGTGRLVARARPTLVSYDRESAVAIGRYAHVERYRFSADELDAISTAYDDEQIRGAEVRYAEEVRIGDTLGPVVRGPLTAEDVICFVERSCPPPTYEYFLDARRNGVGYSFTDEYGIPDSWSSALLLDDVAAREGVPVAHDYGPERVCWVEDTILNWAGDASFLRRLHVRLIAPTVHTHATWLRGEVTGLTEEDGAQVATVQVRGVNQSGTCTIEADAEIELQSLRVPVRATAIR
jgi:hypothetical protein